MTHTYAELSLSPPTWDEIAAKLKEAGYDHAFLAEGTIDLRGLAAVRDPETEERRGSAFAFVHNTGEIEIKTVSDTMRAAMVNTIVIATFGHVVPMNDWSDDRIHRAYLSAAGDSGEVRAVEVRAS